MLQSRAKFHFYGSESIFGIFLRKLVQTWFVLHETWRTILFDIYHCFEMGIIEKNRIIIEIKW